MSKFVSSIIEGCGHCQLGPYFVCKDGPVFKYSDIRGLRLRITDRLSSLT